VKKNQLMDDLIAAIQRRLQTKFTDIGAPSRRLKPADPIDVAIDEKRLGFALPPPIRRVYTEIGNGGFGPGYGLIGLTNGVPDDTGQTAPSIYEQFRAADSTEPNWRWPNQLLPICHWGCAIVSCVDCADSNFRMRIFDPNIRDGDDWADSFLEEADSFEIWIAAWAAGVDLWELMYGKKGHVTQIISARLLTR
jgi:hypothetical protein